jgi:GLPGLI family protein
LLLNLIALRYCGSKSIIRPLPEILILQRHGQQSHSLFKDWSDSHSLLLSLLKRLVLLLCWLVITDCLYAQKTPKDGHVIYRISYRNPTNNGTIPNLETLPDRCHFWFNKQHTLTQYKHPTLGPISYIFNIKNQVATLVFDYQGKTYAVQSVNNTRKTLIDKKALEVVVTPEKEEQDVKGWSCQKAIVSQQIGPATKIFTAYYTESLPMTYDHLEGLNGLLMDYEWQEDGLIKRHIAVYVRKQKVPDKRFNIPSHAKKINYDEFLQLMSL